MSLQFPAPFDLPSLQQLYGEINARDFGGELPACSLVWSRRLTRAAGTILVRERVITLSVPLLLDAYLNAGLFAPCYLVCGVPCGSSESALYEILKHEMIHLWLHERGLPSGHTAAFRAKAKAIGQPKTRHGIARPLPRSGWIYSCPACTAQFTRRQRYGRPVACARCCRQFSRGTYDVRFKLKGQRIATAA